MVVFYLINYLIYFVSGLSNLFYEDFDIGYLIAN